MSRYVIVANRTLGGHELREHVRRIVVGRAGGPGGHGHVAGDSERPEFHVIVPVSERSGAAEQQAQQRLAAQLEQLAAFGATATGALVDDDPYDATMAELREGGADGVVVCTLPQGLSRWLGADFVGRLERGADVDITHIVAPAGMSGRVTGQAVRLTIHIGEHDRHGHTPLHTEIVQRARAAGLAGATVLHGVEGFGASSVIHTSRLLTMSEDLPMVVIVVDTADRIDAFLPLLDELIGQGMVVRERVDVIIYDGR